ncbi:glycosyltransferase family 2 protein [Erythrobacter sp. THAF29]|uniref:glycosyltransferase family 2 protein n=1 Tax=Erythrobacter sp. THAF29 TaxID=2587851 RepID=UPI00126912AB|nr:glycosyltransferase family 2 protein [Erythrobacter sp. THAF29]QFT76306.1 PGL/p-HBAD biosynthesis glycosyltransferase [Erythrobacter sp. THAF29]
MKISVVTAVYNRAETIGAAMKSVQAQTYGLVEHVVQDGGSGDGTLDVIRAGANEHTVIVSERDHGIYDAINRGISRASGDAIGLMHSDDMFASDLVLEKVADALSDPSVDGVYGDLQYVAANNPSRVIRHWKSGEYAPAKLKQGWMPPHPTLYLRREVFDEHGLYDTGLQIAADYDAMLRYLVKGEIKLAYIPEVLVRMRVGGESNRSLERIIRKSREDLAAIRRNGLGGAGVLIQKNLRKVGQFFLRDETSK